MYRGRIQLGHFLPLSLVTRDSGGSPIAPDEAPTVNLYSPTGKVKGFLLPSQDAGAVTGLFGQRLYLGPDYAVGRWTVLYSWKSGSYFGAHTDVFEIVAGGDAEGSVVAMYHYDRPQANFVVHQLDSGKSKRGRNPRV